jgi:hypothetical protein
MLKQEIMKKIITLMIGILILSCDKTTKENRENIEKKQELTGQTENFDWLLGTWIRINEEKGKETFENWVKLNETGYSGIGFTIQNGDTISKEKMRLSKIAKNWNLSVKLSGASDSITFKGVDHNANGFSCENLKNDFPKKIKYWKNGDRIDAEISNPDMKVLFEFEKLK